MFQTSWEQNIDNCSIVKPGPQHTLMEKTNGTLERTMASAVGNSYHITTQHHCRGYFCPRDNVFSCTIQNFHGYPWDHVIETFCQSYNQCWDRTSILDTCRYTPQLNFSAIPFGPDTDWNHWFGTVTKVTAKTKEENVRNLKQRGQDMRFGPFFFVLYRLNA